MEDNFVHFVGFVDLLILKISILQSHHVLSVFVHVPILIELIVDATITSALVSI